jgi:hypothetical protein
MYRNKKIMSDNRLKLNELQSKDTTSEELTSEESSSDHTNKTIWIGIGVGIGVLVIIGIVTWIVRRSKHMQPSSKGYINDENVKSLLANKSLSSDIAKLLKE